MTLLLLQIMIVLLTALLCGGIARKLGQSRVIGEIIGGICLGPSVFGRIAPHSSATLFPSTSFAPLEVLSTIGLVLFLFLIGSELNYEDLLHHKMTAAFASSMSMLLPFLMAVLVAPLFHARFAPAGIGKLPFLLFLGISLSITAFPVLARILEERGIQSTSLGTTALMCAAIDDVSAWLLLATALTLLPSAGAAIPISHRLLWLGAYLVVMVCVVRPWGRWLARRYAGTARPHELLAVAIAVVLGSAAATEAIEIHPLFGAFFAGVCFPRVKQWQRVVRTQLDTVVSVLLLPLFFALTGIRTRLDLLSGVRIWLWTFLILLIAVAGKMGGAVFAARWTGQSWQYAGALGALLNTRGLVELIVLNIAYQAHVFSPTLFTMLVVMALVTTMMTTPLLNLLGIEDHAPSVTETA